MSQRSKLRTQKLSLAATPVQPESKIHVVNSPNIHARVPQTAPRMHFYDKLLWMILGMSLAGLFATVLTYHKQHADPDMEWNAQQLLLDQNEVSENVVAEPSSNLPGDEECLEMVNRVKYCDSPSNDVLPTSWNSKSRKFDCDFKLSTQVEYMPDPTILKCFKSTPNRHWKAAARKYEERIQQLQFPQDCNKPLGPLSEPVWEFGKNKDGIEIRVAGHRGPIGKPKWNMVRYLRHGYAYNLFVMGLNALFHWNAGAPILVSNSRYRFTDEACGRGWSCIQSPLSNCSLEVVNPSQVLAYGQGDKDTTVMTMDQLCGKHGTYSIKFGRCKCDKGYMPSADTSFFFCKPYTAFDFKIPRYEFYRTYYEDQHEDVQRSIFEGNDVHFSNVAPGNANPLSHNSFVRFEHVWDPIKPFGFLWQHSQTLWYLHKYSPRKAQFDGYVKRMGIQKGGCVAVHVRHGDACTDKYQDHRKCLPLEQYMLHATKFIEYYSLPRRIYLATDDPDVILDVKNFPDYEFIVQDIDRGMYSDEGTVSAGVDTRREFNDPKRVDEIALDIWALSHCDAIVGSFASSVVWVALGLKVGRESYYPPFASVDLPWGDDKNVGRFYGRGKNQL